MKRIISIILSGTMIILLFCSTSAVTASAETVTTGNPIAINENNMPRVSEGEALKFYDDFICFDEYDADITNVGNDRYCTIEHTLEDETGINENAYNSTGGSLKLNIGTPYSGVVAAGEQAEEYYSMISDGSLARGIPAANVNNASFAFWSKSDTPLTLVVALYHRWSGVKIVSTKINISAGQNIVEIPLANFVLESGTLDTPVDLTISQYRIYVRKSDFLGTAGTAYFDNIGIYYNHTNGYTQAEQCDNIKVGYNFDSLTSAENWGVFSNAGTIDLSMPESIIKQNSTILWDFDNCHEVSASDTKWISSLDNSLEVEENPANVCGGSGKSLRWQYQSYKSVMCAENVNVSDYTGIIAWIKSDAEITVDLYGLVNGWSKTGSISRKLSIGENIVVFDFKDMISNGENIEKVNIINQMQIRSLSSKTGTIWIDSIGYNYNSDELVNENSYAHNGTSIHYSNENLSSDMSSAARFAYLSQRFDLQDNNGTLWGDKAVIAIWLKSSRAINMKLACDEGYLWNTGKNRWISNRSYQAPAGESVLYIPLSDLTEKQFADQEHREKIWDFIGTMNFYVSAAGTAGKIDLYIDNISVVNPIIGDANDDRKTDVLDLIRIKKLLSNSGIAEAPEYITDVDADGVFDSCDLTTMKKYLFGLSALATAPFNSQVLAGVENMFDNDENTFWSPNTSAKTSIRFSLDNASSFNAVSFTEYNSFITDMTLEAFINGEYTTVCRIDEMGKRTCILEDTYSAKDFRMTLSMSDPTGGISEIKFELKGKISNGGNFRNVGYFTCSSLQDIRDNSYDKLAGYTDIIMFDYGSWDKNGNFLWASKHVELDEQHLAATLNEVRAVPNTDNLNIWFCLQSYNAATTESTDELFATQTARENLVNFSLNLCDKYGLYGIDIDYEYPQTVTAWQNYDAFLCQLADTLHENGYKLSVALSSGGGSLATSTILKIDYANIMAYDSFDSAGRHSTYGLVSRSYDRLISRGFKADQLVMGLPFYTRTTDSTHGYGPGYAYLAEQWSNEIKSGLNVVNSETWNFYFNGPNMIRDKVYFCMSRNMSGVFNWAMSGDIANNNRYGIASLGQTIIDTIEKFSTESEVS